MTIKVHLPKELVRLFIVCKASLKLVSSCLGPFLLPRWKALTRGVPPALNAQHSKKTSEMCWGNKKPFSLLHPPNLRGECCNWLLRISHLQIGSNSSSDACRCSLLEVLIYNVDADGWSYDVTSDDDFAPEMDGAMLPGYLFPLCINRGLLLKDCHGIPGAGLLGCTRVQGLVAASVGNWW
ncbi:hypothetical protein Nepgr_023964 [Nepenthes gracilis]|uniref:Uncharacterized protein n=1 Tax=Nepenthes gracilis TaxID=150966 RepID=A0AAD3T3U9_NEPGR|nr:hypothetical protein Nepgr_023964 [Nepenthes gracilis]